jgi:hypothetical protein
MMPILFLLLISLAHGTWAGAWAPVLLADSPSGQQVAGELAGHAAGALVAPHYNLNGKDPAFTALLKALPTVAPWMDSDGNPGVWFQLSVLQAGA